MEKTNNFINIRMDFDLQDKVERYQKHLQKKHGEGVSRSLAITSLIKKGLETLPASLFGTKD